MRLVNITERGHKDRRRHQRTSENLIVFCTDCGSKWPIEGFTEDISCKGMRIIAEKLFSPKEIVHIELYQPVVLESNIIVAIHIQGEIVWTEVIRVVEKRKFKKGYLMGISFLEYNQKEDIEIIEKYIRSSLPSIMSKASVDTGI